MASNLKDKTKLLYSNQMKCSLSYHSGWQSVPVFFTRFYINNKLNLITKSYELHFDFEVDTTIEFIGGQTLHRSAKNTNSLC